MASNSIKAAKNIYGNCIPGAVYKNTSDSLGVKGKFTNKSGHQKGDHEGTSKGIPTIAKPTDLSGDTDGFQQVSKTKRRGWL